MNKTLWIEVDLGAIRRNMREIRALVGDDVRILAVVKADGYGHGAVEVSRVVLQENADCLGVTRLEDAVALRSASIDAPILVFCSCLPSEAHFVVEHDLEQTICSSALARALSDAAVAQGKRTRVHVKIDTGLGRLGVSFDEAVSYIRAVSGLPGLEIAGVYTHFATAAERDTRQFTRQLEAFEDAIRRFRTARLSFGVSHAAASAAILRSPRSYFDMVRPGTILYGQYPSRHSPRALNLSNPWTLKTRVALVKTLPKGSAVGYGSERKTERRSAVAILPVGFANGLTMLPESVYRRNLAQRILFRMPSNGSTDVTIRGRHAPIMGRVAMELCVADVTDTPGVEVGDEVIVPCRRTAASSRIPRIYIDSER